MIFVGILIFLVAGLVFKHFNWKATPWPKEGLRPPTYQGHRGFWRDGAQENTMSSFKAAKARGLQMIEMDVRLSKDRKVMVFHDNDLKRLGNVDKKVEEFTTVELREKVQAPLLEEILTSTEIPQNLNIELKTGKVFDGELEEKVAELIKYYRAEKRILFSSFNPLAIRRLGKLLPEVPRALLVTEAKDPENKFYLKRMLFAPYIGANALHLDYHYVSMEKLAYWKKRNIPVAFWTVNEQPIADKLLASGALSIITDWLGLA